MSLITFDSLLLGRQFSIMPRPDHQSLRTVNPRLPRPRPHMTNDSCHTLDGCLSWFINDSNIYHRILPIDTAVTALMNTYSFLFRKQVFHVKSNHLSAEQCTHADRIKIFIAFSIPIYNYFTRAIHF